MRTHLAKSLRLSLTLLVVNASLAMVKLLAGLLGHSYALVADAVESMADIFGSFVVWSGLRIAARPADENHPYGHGRAEPLAALIVAMMLFAAALGIAVEAVREILAPHHAPAPFTLGVLIGVVIVKEAFFRIASRLARFTRSSAVLADAWHQRSDAMTSAAAAIGISIALVGGEGYESADDWAALFAAGVIFYNAARLVPLGELMDAEPADIVGPARRLVEVQPNVRGVEKLFARKMGLRYLIDIHLEVDPEMSVREAHDVAHRVKDAILAAMPQVQDVLIHVEPYEGTPAPDAAVRSE